MLKAVQGAAIGLVWLIPAAIVGMLGNVFFDIFGADGLLSFPIWFVLGVFTGLGVFSSAVWVAGSKDWLSIPKKPTTVVIPPALGMRLFVIQMLMLVGLSLFLYWWLWSEGGIDDLAVPGSMPHTLTFFTTTVGGMWLGRMLSVWEFEEAEDRRTARRRGKSRKS